MRDLLILGSWGSGSAAIVRSLTRAGYDPGLGAEPEGGEPRGLGGVMGELNDALLAGHSNPEEGKPSVGRPEPPPVGELQRLLGELLALSPLALDDPRFVYTWPDWRSILEATGRTLPGLVCVFGHPAHSIEEMEQLADGDAELRERLERAGGAEALWVSMYQRLLAMSRRDDWLYFHLDQLGSAVGRARLAGFSGVAIAPGGGRSPVDPDRAGRLADDTLALYAELCERANCRPEGGSSAPLEPEESDVSVVALLEQDRLAQARSCLERIEAQRGVRVEAIFVYVGPGEPPTVSGARVIAPGTSSRSAAFSVGIAHARHDLVALADLDAVWSANHLALAARALQRDPSARWVLSDYHLTDEGGALAVRVSAPIDGANAEPYWFAGLVGHRDAFEGLAVGGFVSGELTLLRELGAQGRIARASEPSFRVEHDLFEAKQPVANRDSRLLELRNGDANAKAPDLSVIVEAGADVHALGLQVTSVCRQLVPSGSIELILVVPDEHEDAWRYACGLESRLAITRLRLCGTGAERLAVALDAARGPRVWWLGAGWVAGPQAAEEHLAAARGQRKVVTLGPLLASNRGGGRALEKYFSGAGGLRGSEAHEGSAQLAAAFAEGNVGFDRDLARSLQGADRALPVEAAAEDLGLRLAATGVRPEEAKLATARPARPVEFDSFREQELARAETRVRLSLTWPALIESEGLTGVGRATLLARVAEHGAALVGLESACRELSGMNVDALHDLGREFRGVADEAVDRLGPLLEALRPVWRAQGLLRGLESCGLESFDEILACVDSDSAQAGQSTRCLAWPRYDDPTAIEELLDACEALVGRPSLRLVLRIDPELDPEPDQVVPDLSAAFDRRYGVEADLQIEIEDRAFEGGADGLGVWWQIRRSTSAVLLAGAKTELAGIALRTGWPTLEDAEAAAGWAAAALEHHADPRDAGPEISVVIPTHDRPEMLRNLLDALAVQSLDAARFEVIVVDDGSERAPLREDDGGNWPFALRMLRQEPAGPGAARNRGIEASSAPLILFLNDDALPDPQLLAVHLEAHDEATTPRAILGTFELLERHRVDSFAELCEQDGLLFAQGRMEPGKLYPGLSFCTGNLSLEKHFLVDSGGFDESYRYAGGEDSELGLRLERGFGLRVQFEPAARCGHDHQLTIDAFARRQRVLGWSIVRMAEAHGDPALVHGRTEPLDDAFFEAVAAELRPVDGRLELLVDEVRAICTGEREGGRGPGHVEELREIVDLVGSIEFRRGLLEARAGREPFERCDTLPVESAVEGPASLVGPSSEARCLAELARHLHRGAIVELFDGVPGAALHLADGLAEAGGQAGPVLAVGSPTTDPRDRQRFFQALAQDHRASLVRLVELDGTSPREFVRGSVQDIGLLVLPADADPRAVQANLEGLAPCLRDGALIVVRGEVPELLVLGSDRGRTHSCQSVGDLNVHRYRRAARLSA